jgi:hypothetical protein
MKPVFLLLMLLTAQMLLAQELYVFSEPASNMPAHTITPKISMMAGRQDEMKGGNAFRMQPEVMLGFSRKLMVHAGSTFSNMVSKGTRFESVFLYGKYRFLSNDDVHRHFRMAAFAEGAYSRNKPVWETVNVTGDRSGLQAGIIATQLVNRVATSLTTTYVHAFDRTAALPDAALNASLSAGVLVLPRSYENFEQLNLNLYAEVLAQRALDGPYYYVDLAPALQLIFNSNSKLNLGYRFEISGTGMRNMPRYFLVSFEHTFFNSLK